MTTMIDPKPARPGMTASEPRGANVAARGVAMRDRAQRYAREHGLDWSDPDDSLRALEAVYGFRMGPQHGEREFTLGGRQRRLTRSEFVVNKQRGASKMPVEQATPTRYGRRADDQDAELDDDDQQLCRTCGKALDQDQLDEDFEGKRVVRCRRCSTLNYLDEDQEATDDQADLSDEELDDDQVELEGYDEDDLYRGPMARFPRQPNRSDGQPTQGEQPSRRSTGGAARSAPGMSPGRDPQDRGHGYDQMGGSERFMTPTERRLARRLATVERTLAGADGRRMIDEAPAPVLGGGLVDQARRYARQHALNWRDPAQQMRAFEAVAGGDPNSLAIAVDTGYAIRATHSRDLVLVEAVTDGEWVDAAKRLAERRGWDYSDPDVRLRAFQAVAAR